MLALGQLKPLRHIWSSKNIGGQQFKESATRMANLEPISTQPDWRETYSQYLPSVENLPLFDQPTSSQHDDSAPNSRLFAPRPSIAHRHSLAQTDLRREPFLSTASEQPDPASESVAAGQSQSVDSNRNSALESEAGPHVSPSAVHAEASLQREDVTVQNPVREDATDEVDDDDDDDMLDAEERHPTETRSATEAERRAERRKMKRFRYVRIDSSPRGWFVNLLIVSLISKRGFSRASSRSKRTQMLLIESGFHVKYLDSVLDKSRSGFKTGICDSFIFECEEASDSL